MEKIYIAMLLDMLQGHWQNRERKKLKVQGLRKDCGNSKHKRWLPARLHSMYSILPDFPKAGFAMFDFPS